MISIGDTWFAITIVEYYGRPSPLLLFHFFFPPPSMYHPVQPSLAHDAFHPEHVCILSFSLSLCTLQLKTSLLIDPVATAARLPLPPHLLRIIPPGWKIPVTRRDIAKTLFPSMMLSLRATLIPSRLDCKYGVIERSPSPPSIEKNRIEKVIEQRSECVASTFVTLALERKSRIRLEQALYIVKFNLNLQDR